jgi:hypothetical protein
MKKSFLLCLVLSLLTGRVIAADTNLNQSIIVDRPLKFVVQAMQTYYGDPKYHGNDYAVSATNEVPGVSYSLTLGDCAFDPSVGGILADMVASRDTALETKLEFVVKSQYSKDFNTASVRQTISRTLYRVDDLAKSIAESRKEQFNRDMLPRVGQKMVWTGFVTPGKAGPCILSVDPWGGIFIEDTTTNLAHLAKVNAIGQLDNHIIRVEGVLHHAEQSPLTVIDGITAQGVEEHFFFNVAEISYSEVKEPAK